MTQTLQQSHDNLAYALVQFVDQLQRGSHPTVLQWMDVARALRGAAAHVGPEADTLATWLTAVAGVIDESVTRQTTT